VGDNRKTTAAGDFVRAQRIVSQGNPRMI